LFLNICGSVISGIALFRKSFVVVDPGRVRIEAGQERHPARIAESILAIGSIEADPSRASASMFGVQRQGRRWRTIGATVVDEQTFFGAARRTAGGGRRQG
jgi:hypothetical protein